MLLSILSVSHIPCVQVVNYYFEFAIEFATVFSF